MKNALKMFGLAFAYTTGVIFGLKAAPGLYEKGRSFVSKFSKKDK